MIVAMKWIGITAMALTCGLYAGAQNIKDTMLVDYGYNFVSDVKKAKHKVLVSKNDNGDTRLLVFSMDGYFQSEENFKHFSYGKSKRIREGKFTKKFYRTDVDSLVSFYHDDNAVWPKVLNYRSGNKWIEYKSDRTVAPYTEVKEYYESGRLKHEETTVAGEDGQDVTTGHSYDENGNEIEFVPFYVKARFPGGDKNLYKNINEYLHYPDALRNNPKEGKVIVNVTVEASGYPSGFRAVYASDEAFTEEALRAIKIATAGRKFKPTQIGGIDVKAICVIPIYFKLPNK